MISCRVRYAHLLVWHHKRWLCHTGSITWPKYAGRTTTDWQLSGQIAPRMLPSLQSATLPPIHATVLVDISKLNHTYTAAIKAVAQVQYNCNSTIQLQYKNFSCIAVALHLCWTLQYNVAIQVFHNLQKTCRLLAAVMWKKLILQLYCACADCCNTTKFLCYVIIVVL